jgi:hypothetical protein
MLRWLYAPPTAGLMGEVLAALVLSLTTYSRKASIRFPSWLIAVCIAASTITASCTSYASTSVTICVIGTGGINEWCCNS